MTETLLTESEFRALLEENGLKLEGAALQAALMDARRNTLGEPLYSQSSAGPVLHCEAPKWW